MLVPNLFGRDSYDASPLGCQPLSFSTSVCVGDLIAIVACSIAGLGFIFWSIHAIRKMRNDPLNALDEGKYSRTVPLPALTLTLSEDPNHGVDPDAFDHSILVQPGVAQTPSYPDRVRTRLALSQPEEDFYRFTNPASIEAYTGQTPTNVHGTPRRPPPAGGQSKRASRRSSRQESLVRGGEYDPGTSYGDYRGNDGPSRARGSTSYGSSGGHRSMGRMAEGHPKMYRE